MIRGLIGCLPRCLPLRAIVLIFFSTIFLSLLLCAVRAIALSTYKYVGTGQTNVYSPLEVYGLIGKMFAGNDLRKTEVRDTGEVPHRVG